MTIKVHNCIQGSEEWHAARCGLLTASEVDRIITPKKLEFASNDKCRAHVYELLAQRVTRYVEPSYISDSMLRGKEEEIDARDLYSTEYEPVQEVGFITNDKWGFTLGCSPDGLIGDGSGLEVKSRCQKYQMQSIIEGKVPEEFMLQIQTCMLVTERREWKFASYSGGLPFLPVTVPEDVMMQDAIVRAAEAMEAEIARLMTIYLDRSKNLIPTERRDALEIYI